LPSGTFTLSLQGSEYAVSKAWAGTQDKLTALQDEIVATCILLLESQPKRREERLAEERRRRDEAERAERKRRVAQARRDQLERAFKAAEAHERVERLRRFLAVVESEMESYNPPYDERARAWLQVVREELDRSNPYLEILTGCWTVPSWAKWPPEWWPVPTDVDSTASDSEPASSD
jgi:polyhydroxyalkanoate synthesis regulator phasin